MARHLTRIHRGLIGGLVLSVMFVSLVTASVGCSFSSSGTTTTLVAAPDFSGVTLDGEEVSLSDYAGRPLVLVFMASWCSPCRAESPEIDQFYKDNKDRAALLGVAVNDSEEDIRAFMAEEELSFPMMINNDDAPGAYGVAGIPTTVVIDPEGYIVKRIVGGTNAYTLSLIVDGITR